MSSATTTAVTVYSGTKISLFCFYSFSGLGDLTASEDPYLEVGGGGNSKALCLCMSSLPHCLICSAWNPFWIYLDLLTVCFIMALYIFLIVFPSLYIWDTFCMMSWGCDLKHWEVSAILHHFRSSRLVLVLCVHTGRTTDTLRIREEDSLLLTAKATGRVTL